MEKSKSNILSKIPPVNQVLEHPDIQPLVLKYSHELILTIIQQETKLYKKHLLQDENSLQLSREKILDGIVLKMIRHVENLTQFSLRKVINATGIILHTGLGRAPIIEAAKENLLKIADGYCSLEIDLESGKRGQRTSHVEELICMLTGAEAACVVNNNAAAVLLMLNTLCFGKEAIISRGQLIEIGGSFRIPEVMEKSGAKMVEVGTTNKTHLKDYEKAISEKTGIICLVHPSNYRIKGFIKEPNLTEVIKLGIQFGVPVVQDLGGGVLIDLQRYGLPYEPVVGESVASGFDVITFSGDKVLGGPQSGIIVGKRKFIEKIKTNPLMRTLRCDKLIYAVLEPTLQLYLNEKELLKQNLVLKMLLEPLESIETRISELIKNLSNIVNIKCQIKIENTFIQIGSGALPLEELPSKAISLKTNLLPVDKLAKKFRMHNPPIIGYIRDDKLYFDFRTIGKKDERKLLNAIEEIIPIKQH